MVDSIKEERAIELYSEFRKELRSAPLPEIAPYPRPFEGGTLNGLAMPFHTVAQDALREIANSINDLGRYYDMGYLAKAVGLTRASSETRSKMTCQACR